MERRLFMKAAAATGGAGVCLSALSLLTQRQALAQSFADYKALVCIFLFGGNDGFNTLVPYESVAHAQYLTFRPEFNSSNQSGLGLPRQALLPLSISNGNPAWGLHPALVKTQSRWDLGQVAWVRSVGNLVEPVSRANFSTKRVPLGLAGHPEQQDVAMTAVMDPQGVGSEQGWAARLLQQGRARGLPIESTFSQISFAGQNRLQSSPMWPTSVLGANELLPVHAENLIRPLLAQGSISSRPFVRAYADVMSHAYAQAQVVNSVFSSIDTSAAVAYRNALSGGSGLSQQLLAVARFIEARSQLQAPGRQVFFVAAGGYDTHEMQYNAHASLLTELDTGLHAFFSAMDSLGLSQQVTAFTMSDFGRTLRANASHGTDHAWASHLMVMGGAVRGGLYGRAADITPSSEDIAPNDSNWVIPSTSINQYAATLAAWMGLNPTDLNAVFPDLRNFTQANLGFMNS